ncbi:MAG: hypothetical protein ACI3U0_05050 [Oscillospiraceae bacterium]
MDGVKLVPGGQATEKPKAAGEVFPDAKYQRRTVRFYRNVFSAEETPTYCDLPYEHRARDTHEQHE